MPKILTPKLLLEYPKIFCFLVSCGFAYLLFRSGNLLLLTETLNGQGYWSALVAGLLFSFGFTAPFAIGIFVSIAPEVHPYLAGMIGGLGAFVSDFCIFQFVRISFTNEIGKIRLTKWFMHIHNIIHHPLISERIRTYLLWSIAGLVIASPLPDEFGITLISSASDINKTTFAILCFVLNTIGITMLLITANALT